MKEISAFDKRKREELEAKADRGSITAIQVLEKIKRQERLHAAREEMMGQAMFDRPEGNKEAVKDVGIMPSDRSMPAKIDELDISEIEKFIQTGEFKSLPEHMAVYLKWMEIAHDWYYKFKGRNWVMRYLMANCKNQDGEYVSYYMAEKIFNDMMVFFYPDQNFKRNSWLRYLAERIEMGANLALEDNDFETYGKNMERSAKVLGMITLEKSDTDPRLLDRRPRFFSTNAKELGVPEVNRYELARQIDDMDISERDKLSAKRDLGVVERDITEGE